MNTEQATEALLSRAAAGDDAALEALLESVQPQLYRFSMKMCRHSADAEDVLQDSLLAAARSIRTFRGDATLSTWLFTIVRRFCIKKRRKRAGAPDHEESLDALSPTEQHALRDTAPTPHDAAESAEVWRVVQAALATLPPDDREVLVLRDIEGLRAKEVADVIGASVSAVKSRLHRARAKLREALAESPYRPGANCPDIRTIFSTYIEGDLSPEICTVMEAHVEACPACAAECDGLKAALNACSSAPCDVPQGVADRVREELKRALDKTAHR